MGQPYFGTASSAPARNIDWMCEYLVRPAIIIALTIAANRNVPEVDELLTSWIYLEGKELLSEKSLTTIDCAAKKVGAEVVMTFSGKDTTGSLLGNMETPMRLTSIKSGTADDALMKVVCR